jgi:hypothetical protein
MDINGDDVITVAKGITNTTMVTTATLISKVTVVIM